MVELAPVPSPATTGTAEGDNAATATCPGGRIADSRKLAEAPKAEIAVPKPVKPKPKPQPPKPVRRSQSRRRKNLPRKSRSTRNRPRHRRRNPQQPAPGPSPAQQAAQCQLAGRPARSLGQVQEVPGQCSGVGARKASNRLRFVVDAEGNVLSFELVGGSGNAASGPGHPGNDPRAQPLPKPPADMLNNGSIEIVAPFVYSLERRR